MTPATKNEDDNDDDAAATWMAEAA